MFLRKPESGSDTFDENPNYITPEVHSERNEVTPPEFQGTQREVDTRRNEKHAHERNQTEN